MDTFFEQLIKIRKNYLQAFAVLGIWLGAIILALAAFYFLMGWLPMIALFVIVGAFYGAYKLCGRLNIEYEYIITNGTFDVDKIMAKSTRKRLASFELSAVTRLEKFNPALLNGNFSKKIIACNPQTEDAYLLDVPNRDGTGLCLVIAPNDRMKEAMVKFLPKYISNSAFK